MAFMGSTFAGLAVACTLAYYSDFVESCLGVFFNGVKFNGNVAPAVSAIVGYLIGVTGFHLLQWIRWLLIRRLLTYSDWIYNHRSRKTKVWGGLLWFLLPKKWGTHTFQDYLPRYPLPDLGATFAKTMKVMKPLMSEKEYEAFLAELLVFLNGEAPKLQAKLQKRYETEDNWLIDLWNKYAYLAGRSPLQITSNFCTLGMRDPLTDVKQTALAASVIHHMMRYKKQLENETIPGMMIQDIIPICCDRYKFVFSHTRIPGQDIDELKGYENSNHIIIFRKGHMYEFELYAEDDVGRRTLLTPLEIQGALEQIVADADGKGKAESPGVFTTMERSTWAKVREQFRSVKPNGQSLDRVESAAFCIEVADTEPQDFTAEFQEYIAGDCSNRWFDKSLLAIITKNLKVGLNDEHTACEATVTGRTLEYVLYHLRYDQNGNTTHEGLTEHKNFEKPKELQWNLAQFKEDMHKQRLSYEAAANDLDPLVRIYEKGKGEIKKQRVSPDGFLQMAMQLAYYRLHKHTPKTYETAATRIFKKGRTETIRSVSEHSVAFTKAFDDPSAPDSVKIDHLMKAINYQTMYKFDATTGCAVDRHLFGLYIAGKMSGTVPKIFSMMPFLEPDKLSTSQSPMFYDPVIMKLTPYTPVGGGFGAQHPDGYGVAYFMLGEHQMHFLISSYKSCAETGSVKFADAINAAMDGMLELLQSRSNTRKTVANGDGGTKKNKNQ